MTQKPLAAPLRGLALAVLTTALCCASGAQAAGIYRTVNKDGTVTYTDRPQPGQHATPVNVDGVGNQYPSERVPYEPAQSEPAPAASSARAYTEVNITSPASEATIHSNEGIVPVAFQVQPPLRAGDSVRVLLDGRAAPVTSGEGGAGQLSNIDRGAHTLVVQVLDHRGKPLLSSPPVTFYVHKASVLLGPNARPNGPARRPAGAVMTPPKPPK